MILVLFRKHILDALPYVSNAASVELMKDIILQHGVPQDKVNDWLFSMAFIIRPDESTLESVAQLLEQRSNDSAVSLSIAALTHSYCVQNTDCLYNDAVNRIVQLLQRVALDAYNTDKLTREAEDNVRLAYSPRDGGPTM